VAWRQLLLDGAGCEAGHGALPLLLLAERCSSLCPTIEVVTGGAVAQDGLHGKAWGVLTWQGVAGPRREIRGTLKPVWQSAEEPVKVELAGPKL
jgi:hypothetical protein